ncbi:GPW/gp25 family protein [Elizabethkingia miricola]|uniref:GPW/gp25 family protein n=1 Tax=Elizabethkingia miricola TaxID=172045 RepID=UPI002ACE51BD|nr:GPW/gp25 family protein [Elizabethkingia miricola]WQM39429.1 GPW/gp25 family protein [Elizabethkingia miricola]
MKGFYYKLPLDFESLIRKKDIDNISLDTSIAQSIFLLATTAFGECKFDETYGTKIWEIDFDIMKRDSSLKVFIAEALEKSINTHEKRLVLKSTEVLISDYNLGTLEKIRVKKRVIININGIILETNLPFTFSNSFFIGPLSY